MIYIIPTKKGIGAELWGTRDDLNVLHEVIAKYWNDEKYTEQKGFDSRDLLISSFSYEIRKAYQGSRLMRPKSHYSFEPIEYLGCQISWVHFLFSLIALRYNMRFYDVCKFDTSIFLQLEFWIEKAMNNYDEIGAKKLCGYIGDGLYGANEHIYLFMRKINLDFVMLGGGKRAFRRLPDLLKQGVFNSDEYNLYITELEEDSKRLKCPISEMDLDDDFFDYDNMKW